VLLYSGQAVVSAGLSSAHVRVGMIVFDGETFACGVKGPNHPPGRMPWRVSPDDPGRDARQQPVTVWNDRAPSRTAAKTQVKARPAPTIAQIAIAGLLWIKAGLLHCT
jgi:hypothetical protein